MKVWDPGQDDANFELTPMIDVVFLLIAFFMTVTTFATAELIKVDLPTASEAKVPEEMGDRQFISITKDGEYFLGGRLSNLEEIKAALLVRSSHEGFRGIYVRADDTTPFRYISDLMEKSAEVGVFNVIFATQQE